MDDNNFLIPAWTLSDHSATLYDIIDVALTCKYRNDNRLSKVASQISNITQT